ncbi:MAG: hypothetical protein QOH91_3519, partial [Mycobacterium sp.]|nr:hypothetical protein [Mycobacterium sp.]
MELSAVQARLLSKLDRLARHTAGVFAPTPVGGGEPDS